MGYRMQADWPAHGPRRFFYPSNYITLGWAFPAALGAQYYSYEPIPGTHIKGALTNGVTREEIREVILQVAIYAGVPAGIAMPPISTGSTIMRLPSWFELS